MADNSSFIKMDVFYAEEQVTISSSSINAMGDRIILMGDDFDLVPHQSNIEVVGYLQDGIVFMNGKVTLSTDSQINFDIIKTDNKQERRSYLKVRVHLNTTLFRAFSLGRSNKSYSLNEPIQTRDLSLGGIAFYSNSILFKKQKVEIDFNILKPGFIARAEVLRKERGPFRGGYRFKYGCRFLNISGEEERVLCEFVFRTQIENHRKLMRQDDLI
ncbi:MAG TPA: PilZ domain-containing protein [Anaerovoracaceae bacterium]|nr:PilZ domain-containing protein [Anaerovoracaceae bacterium]